MLLVLVWEVLVLFVFIANYVINVTKIRRDYNENKVGYDGRGQKPEEGVDNVALKILLGEEVCDEIDREKEEEMEMLEAESRNQFNIKKMEFNFARRRATDLKNNSRVYFHRKARSLEEEAKLETIRVELMAVFKNYVSKYCKEVGKQDSNLIPSQSRGLKTLKKRVTQGELVIIPTDKSGRLAVMTRESYKVAGLRHTQKDREVDWLDISESQKELNDHVSMLTKIFRIGGYWDHGPRIRETTMGEGMSVCSMSLLFKDHKGWSAAGGTAPPTRPVVGGHLGINLHISELVSDILDPVVDTYVGGKEIISTEDMVAKTEILNDDHKDWNTYSYWGGMETEEYVSCTECMGEDDYKWSDEDPEQCVCEEYDGIHDDGRMMITMGAMKKLRRSRWEESVNWNQEDLTRIFQGGG